MGGSDVRCEFSQIDRSFCYFCRADHSQWSNGRIIALLTLQGILFIAFVSTQILLPKTATVPPRILKYRSVAGAFWATFCISSSQYIFSMSCSPCPIISQFTDSTVYYLPIWFQTIKGVAAIDSGIHLLPLLMAFVFGTISGGLINQKIGYYTPVGIAGACVMAAGAGLLTTFQVDTAKGKWIGYQVLYGLGQGYCFQVPNLAAQVALPKPDVPIGMALMFFSQLIGSAIFVSVGENVLGNQLVKRLSGVPGFNPNLVTSGGATSLLSSLAADQRGVVLVAYNEALRTVYQIGLILACLAVLGLAVLEWKSVLKQPTKKAGPEKTGLEPVNPLKGASEQKV